MKEAIRCDIACVKPFLPISRRSLIAGRYAVVLGFGLCAVALCVPLAIAVDSIVFNAVVFEQATALFYTGVVSLAAALLLCSFVMPLVTLFGTAHGMRFFACGIGAVAAVVVVLLGRLLPSSVVSAFVESIEANLLFAVIASILVALVLYGVSCMVCTHIYCRRDL